VLRRPVELAALIPSVPSGFERTSDSLGFFGRQSSVEFIRSEFPGPLVSKYEDFDGEQQERERGSSYNSEHQPTPKFGM
jgi:hypothetical protein